MRRSVFTTHDLIRLFVRPRFSFGRRRRIRTTPIFVLIVVLIALAQYLSGNSQKKPAVEQPAAPRHSGCSATHAPDIACIGSSAHGFSACVTPGTPETRIREIETQIMLRGEYAAYSQAGRWTNTATNGLSNNPAQPITLTYSFPPDTNTGNPQTSNAIHATLDAAFGSREAWRELFADIFTEWSLVTGIEFIEVADDGAAWPNSPGVAGVRGDIRIVSYAIDGVYGVLAYNYFPNLGDMCLDKDEDWANPTHGYRFIRNVLAHELGHGLGLNHVLPRDNTKLMEAYLSLAFDGPQDDDIRGATGLYGDAAEPNATPGSAASFAAHAVGGVAAHLSLHSTDDVDWFWINIPAGQAVTILATPVGATYLVSSDPGTPVSVDTASVHPLRVAVHDASGMTLLRSAEAAAGNSIFIDSVAPLTGTSTLRIKVFTSGGGEGPQRYALSISASERAVRTITLASTPTGAGVTCSPAAIGGVANATTPSTLTYLDGELVTFHAPAEHGGLIFQRWYVDGAPQTTGIDELTLAISRNMNLTAMYTDGPVVSAIGDQILYAGDSVRLNCTVSGGAAPYSFAWSPATGLSATNVADPLVAPLTTTTYTVTATDANGNRDSDTVLVIVRDALIVQAGDDRVVASGSTIALTPFVSGGTPPYQYAWSPEQLVSAPTSRDCTATIAQDAAFTLTVTDSLGRSAADTLHITVAPALAIDLGPDLVAAAGDVVELAPAITGGAGPYSCSWQNAPTTATLDGCSLATEIRQPMTIRCTVTDAVGQVATDSLSIRVPAELLVAASGSPSVIDPGETVTLEGAVSGGQGPYQVAWAPAETVENPAGLSTLARPTETTTYTLAVTDSLGQTRSATVTVIVASAEDVVAPAVVGRCGFGLVGAVPLTALALGGLRRRVTRHAGRRAAGTFD